MIHLYTNNCNIRYIVFPTTETFFNNDGTHSFALARVQLSSLYIS